MRGARSERGGWTSERSCERVARPRPKEPDVTWFSDPRYGCSSCQRVFSTPEALIAHQPLTEEYVTAWRAAGRHDGTYLRPPRKGDRRCTTAEELQAAGQVLCRDDVWRPESDVTANPLESVWDRATRRDRAAQSQRATA